MILIFLCLKNSFFFEYILLFHIEKKRLEALQKRKKNKIKKNKISVAVWFLPFDKNQKIKKGKTIVKQQRTIKSERL